MPEDTEHTSAEDVLQSSELAARLLRRLVASPGVIDTQRVFKTYARLTEMITHAHPLLHDLLVRYYIDDDSAVQNLPLVMDQPWMLNLNTYLTNNNSYSSSSTTNNSFVATSNTNQFISTASISSTSHTELHGATSQSSPPETFRVSRSRAGRRQSVPVDATDRVLNPISRLPESSTSSVAHVEAQPRRLATGEDQKSTQEKPGPSSLPAATKLTLVQPPLARTSPASPVIQRELLETETKTSHLVLKNSETVKTERHSVKSNRIEVRERSNTPQNSLAESGTMPAPRTPPTLPLVQEQLPSTQFQTRPQQLVWRKSADSLTLRDLVSDLSSSGPLASVRQALDSLPMAQVSPSAQTIKPESLIRADEPSTSEEITTEGMLRRISKMLLIERERRGY